MPNCDICKDKCTESLPIVKIGVEVFWGVVNWKDVVLCNNCKDTRSITDICKLTGLTIKQFRI